MTDLVTIPPLEMTASGPIPQSIATLNAQLIQIATALSPGLTANLPGSLIEDISSTDTAALALIDSARVDLINSITPYGANRFLLKQLGAIYGVAQGKNTNTSVYQVFSGPPGYVITVGFTVSDGTYQYTVQDGGVIGSGGTSQPLFCVAVLPGIWAVPPNTVNQLITSVPSSIALSTTNPITGTPGTGDQSIEDYRAQVIEAGLATAQGMPTFLRAMLQQVPGVQPNLISIQQADTGWRVICGGGDPYLIGYAIFMALFDISLLVGSAIDSDRNVTPAINDYPNVYNVIFVNPPQQTVAINVTWNTNSTGFVSPTAVAQLASQPLINYVNSLPVGQPMNLFELQSVFQQAIASVIPPQLLTRMVFLVAIDGTTVAPEAGTGIIAGDPESYFFTTAPQIIVNQG